PITAFDFESFEVRVQRVTRRRPLPIGVSFRKLNGRRLSRQFKTVPGPINAVHGTQIFLPSPSLQGHGWMSLRLGARPVDHSAALSPLQLHLTAPGFFTKGAREPNQIAPISHK